MGKDITRILVEATVRKTLKEIPESPERTIRNLVDLALNFSNGKFQKEILGHVQELLKNENSAYFKMATDIISHVNPDNITTFGLNTGYNSCTKGAKIIREIEKKKGYNIPWSLSFSISSKQYQEKVYQELLSQGQELGIFTYLIFLEGNPQFLLPLIRENPACAFVLFTNGEYITKDFLAKTKDLHHLMPAVEADDYAPSACRLLRENQMLYSAFLCYDEKEKQAILSGQILRQLIRLKPVFSFFIPSDDCRKLTEKEIYQYIVNVRNAQQTPTLLMDIKYDNMFIDSIISDDACTAAFDAQGFLHGPSLRKSEHSFNCFKLSLQQIFSLAFPKNI